MHPTSESSENESTDVSKGAAMKKMKKLAQKIYDTTPGINTRKFKTVSKPFNC
jgi:hypothetical protein